MIPTGGQLLLTVPVAVAAGALSFASPCVLPLIPGYLGYVGSSGQAVPQQRRRTVLGAALFVLGFSVVFVSTSTAFGALGFLVMQHLDLVTRAAGAVVIVLGLAFVGALGPLQRRIAPTWRPRTGLLGAPLLGVVFALGWTPCAGPTLALIQAMAFTSGSLGASVLVATAYSLGLGIPFILIALGVGWATRTIATLRRHIRAVNLAGGGLLVLVGLLMLSGVWNTIVTALQISVQPSI